MNARDKVNQIIQEIEMKQGSNEDIKLTTQQVMDKLLDKKSMPGELHTIGGTNSKYPFDMEELSLCKENNNNFYRINYYNSIICLKKFVGKPLVLMNKVFRKIFKFIGEPIVDQQNKFNASVTASINALYNNEIVTQSFINDVNAKLVNTDIIIDILQKQATCLEEKLNYSTDQIIMLEGQLSSSIGQLSSSIGQITALEEQNTKRLSNVQISLDNKLDYLNFKMHQLTRLKKTSNDEIKRNLDNNIEIVQSSNTYDSIDYFDFENHFRGSRQNIKDSQQGYIEYFKNKSNVIDLGCGRGEFLELMKENDVQATGVDLYKEFVDYCIFKGLNAVEADAIKYLSQLDDDSVQGIFSSQLVEHLHTDQILSLCRLAYRKLKDDAYLIIETPNPTCLSIYTNCFYVDPSHVKPVHPLTLEYFLKKAGFKDINIIYTEQSKVNYTLPLLDSEEIKNLSEFNDGINLLSNIIFGSQDYAIIARK